MLFIARTKYTRPILLSNKSNLCLRPLPLPRPPPQSSPSPSSSTSSCPCITVFQCYFSPIPLLPLSPERGGGLSAPAWFGLPLTGAWADEVRAGGMTFTAAEARDEMPQAAQMGSGEYGVGGQRCIADASVTRRDPEPDFLDPDGASPMHRRCCAVLRLHLLQPLSSGLQIAGWTSFGPLKLKVARGHTSQAARRGPWAESVSGAAAFCLNRFADRREVPRPSLPPD